MPTISVIVPVYKVEAYLQRCVDSILAQTFRDFELILVDDGSPDRCGVICDEYACNYDYVHVIHKENGGLSDARNAGIDWALTNSDSSWIAFVDSDDYLHAEYLQRLYRTAQETSADLVVCDFIRVDEIGEKIEEEYTFPNLVTEDKNVIFDYLNRNWRIRPSWNKLYSKELFRDIRFAYRKIHEDEFIIHHVLWKCRKLAVISDGLYYYVTRQNSITTTESPATLMDGQEALIEQCEFEVCNNLPVNELIVSQKHSNEFLVIGSKLIGENRRRFQELKKRYEKIYFGKKENQKLKRRLIFYCNGLYRRLKNRH